MCLRSPYTELKSRNGIINVLGFLSSWGFFEQIKEKNRTLILSQTVAKDPEPI